MPPGEVSRLSRLAEEAASQHSDPVAVLLIALKTTIAGSADPYLLAGALIEGVANVIAAKVPHERQGVVAVEAVRLLRDRLREWGAV